MSRLLPTLLMIGLFQSTTMFWCAAASAGFFTPTNGPNQRETPDLAAAPDGDVFAVSASGAYVQAASSARWSRLPALPASASKVEVGPDGRVWLFGSGTNLVSANKGATWQSPGIVPPMQHLAFAGSVVFAGTATGLYRSTNGGNDWLPAAVPAVSIDAIDVDGGVVWAAAASELYRSPDLGATWSMIGVLPLHANALEARPEGGVYAGLQNIGWPTCQLGGLYHIADDGTATLLDFQGRVVYDLLVHSNGDVDASISTNCTVYQLGCGQMCYGEQTPECREGGVYRSVDAGATWSRLSALQVIPKKFVSRPNGTLVGSVLGTGNCDICWSLPPGVQQSADGGVNWTPDHDGLGPRGPVEWVAAHPTTPLLLAADSYSMYASTDGGVTWSFWADPSPVHCAQVYGSIAWAINPVGYGFAIDYDASVFRVLGPTLSALSPPLPGDPYNLRHAASTGSGTLLVSTGSGIAFAPAPAITGFLGQSGPASVDYLVGGPGPRAAAATQSSTYLTNDAGLGWTLIANVGNGPLAFSSLGDRLYVASYDFSTQGTTLWALVEVNGWQGAALPAFPEARTRVLDMLADPGGGVLALAIFNSTTPTRVLRLRSGATTWEEMDSSPNFASKITMDTERFVYVATPDGVWRSISPLGITTDIGPGSDVLTAVGSFPNPSGGLAHIQYTLSRRTHVHLAVYDVRGRLMQTLVANAPMNEGFHEAIWDPGAAAANGLYVYRLQTPAGTRSGQFLLLR